MEQPKEVSFNKLVDAINFVDEKMELLNNNAKGFATSFKELTGFSPEHRVSALDVVKIAYKLYGEPK